jgi:hypothetical protein
MSTNPDRSAALDRGSQQLDQSQRGWWSRNWKWFVPGVIFVCLVLIFVFLTTVYVMIHRREPYMATMQAARDHQEVKEALGESIKDLRWIPGGRYGVSGDQGDAEMIWEIAGSRGQGTLHVVARRRGGKWEYITMEATLPGGKKVSLIKEDEGNVAPPFKPQGEEAAKKPEADAPPLNIDLKIPEE